MSVCVPFLTSRPFFMGSVIWLTHPFGSFANQYISILINWQVCGSSFIDWIMQTLCLLFFVLRPDFFGFFCYCVLNKIVKDFIQTIIMRRHKWPSDFVIFFLHKKKNKLMLIGRQCCKYNGDNSSRKRTGDNVYDNSKIVFDNHYNWCFVMYFTLYTQCISFDISIA